MPRRHAVTAALLLCAMAAQASPLTPLAPAFTAGTYTVTGRGCTLVPAGLSCEAAWLEERQEPAGTFTASTGEFTARPAGQYAYRSADLVCDPATFECTERRSAAIYVTVSGEVSPAPALADQQQYRYRVRTGDTDADGAPELLLELTSPAGTDPRLISRLLLSPAGASLAARVPTATELTATQWEGSEVSVQTEDINVDGFIDLVLSELPAAMNLPDSQVVFAPGFRGGLTGGIRPLTPAIRQFTANMLDYIANHNYFEESAPTRYLTYVYQVPYCVAGSYDTSWSGSHCYPIWMPGTLVVSDYSVFAGEAIDIWRLEEAAADGTLTTAEAAGQIGELVGEVIGSDLGGWDMAEVFAAGGDLPADDERAGLEPFLALLGIASASAQEIQPDRAPAPPAVAADTLYIAGRHVFGRGIQGMHTAIQYRAPGAAVPVWFSAFDSDRRALFDGRLVAESSDPRDHPLLMRMLLGTVTPPAPLSPAQYLASHLLPAHQHYEALPESQVAPYDAIPELPPCASCRGRNSNGYVHGLIRATTATPNPLGRLDLNHLTGWRYPVEAGYFGR